MRFFTKGTIISIVIFLFVSTVSAVVYPLLPERIVSHWGMYGEANGEMGRLFGVLFLPIVLFLVVVFMNIFPRFDPKKRNIEAVRVAYDSLIILISSLFALLQFFVLAVNLGFPINPSKFFAVLLGLFIFANGFVIERLKQNWSIGIRTPWTLSSEAVWKKTHLLGGKIFKIIGVIACFGVVFPSAAFFLFIIPLVVGIIILFIFSYKQYRNENKNPL